MKLILFFWVSVIVKWVLEIVFMVVDIIGIFNVILWVSWVCKLVVCGRMVEWLGMSNMLLKVRVFWMICSM